MSKTFFTAYATTAALFLTLDSLWLGLISRTFYPAQLGGLLLGQPRIGAALMFYLIYLAGIVTFCVLPGLERGGASRAAWRGVLFGLVAYGTYDLTNLATLRGWSETVVAVDMVWGALATGVAACGSAWATRALARRFWP